MDQNEMLEEIGKEFWEILEGVRDEKISVGHAYIAIMLIVKVLIQENEVLIEDQEQFRNQLNDLTHRAAGAEALVILWKKSHEVDTAGLEAQVNAFKAARIAYANEFPLDAEGSPDVGSIHENIRSLKSQLIEYKEQLRVANDVLTTLQEGASKPVAFGLFWKNHDGVEVLQFPVGSTEQDCQNDLQMYDVFERQKMTIRKLYTNPQPTEKGYACVPTTPTDEMLEAVPMSNHKEMRRQVKEINRETYEIMIAAAPTNNTEVK